MSWQLRNECERREVEGLAKELGVSEVLASVLVRRGFDDACAGALFLDAELPAHDPFELGDMREACDAIRAAVAAGTKICVHGDYDADGICATALAVLVLRELGAEVSYHLPSRFDEGYGVSGETLTRLAGEGVGLVLTVDCGVTAVAEVAHARELGLDVVVTDHHRPGRRAAGVSGRRPLPRRLSVPRAVRDRRRVEARAGAARRRLGGARAPPRPRRGGDGRRRRAAAGREPRPRGRRPALARAHAEAGAAGADARRAGRRGGGRRGHDRLPARTEAERGRPAGEAGGRARAAADRGARAKPAASRSSWRSSTATARPSRSGSCARRSRRSSRGRRRSAGAAPTWSRAPTGTKA